jgi:hypothetical protein
MARIRAGVANTRVGRGKDLRYCAAVNNVAKIFGNYGVSCGTVAALLSLCLF